MIIRNLLRYYGSNIVRNGHQQRNASILSSLESSPVLISSNKDVYTNLALEHWLYTNLKFKENTSPEDNDKVFTKPVVFIWTDEPCVVMGRHQNPWVESTLGFVNRAGVKLARRHSGGGCVYHDENNINISIIGPRKNFENRQSNLKFLAKVLFDKYSIKCEPTKRHDLVDSTSGRKISGSAAKLGRFNCYHHFTVLVDTDKEVMSTAIRQTQQNFIQTNSSVSTRSSVVNLKELRGDLDVDQVISDLSEEYSKHYGNSAAKQPARKDRVQGQQVDYQNLDKFREELQSWDWIYGMTPKFKLERSFKLIEAGVEKQVKFLVTVNKGLFEDFQIEGDLNYSPSDSFKYLIGTKFTYKDAMINVTKLLQFEEGAILNNEMAAEKIFTTYLLQMIQECNY